MIIERSAENGFGLPDMRVRSALRVIVDEFWVNEIPDPSGGQEGEECRESVPEDCFAPFVTDVTRELILELVKVRTTGTSDLFSNTTLWKVREPALNDALVHLLVRSLR